MPDLILDSLEIQNFRVFRHLTIDRLARVNLIVGKNNVGKTTILEALRLYSNPGSLDTLIDLHALRDEFDVGSLVSDSRRKQHFLPFNQLFHNRKASLSLSNFTSGESRFSAEVEPLKGVKSHTPSVSPDEPPTFKIGAKGLPKDALCVSFEFINKQKLVNPLDVQLIFRTHGVIVTYTVQTFSDWVRDYWTGQNFSVSLNIRTFPTIYLKPGGLDSFQTGSLWDAIALTSLEKDVIESMRVIDPNIDRLVLKPIQNGIGSRVPFVKMNGEDPPRSLRSLGDGVYRMFCVVLALVSAKNGLLLIDEIESGIHYSVQPDLWRLIFQVARRLNVQVFATTHSYDCIKAFEEAARESDEEGVLIRLAQKAGQTLVGEFDERELGIAVEGQIEVR